VQTTTDFASEQATKPHRRESVAAAQVYTPPVKIRQHPGESDPGLAERAEVTLNGPLRQSPRAEENRLKITAYIRKFCSNLIFTPELCLLRLVKIRSFEEFGFHATGGLLTFIQL
jgi:hypothetical protein